jgi:hypothetical protein
MRKLTKLWQLPAADLLLLAAAAALLLLFTTAIRTLPFATVSRLQWPAPARRRDSPAARARILRAVRTAAPYLPAANCLPQALAARALLRAHGAPANLRLGVTKTETGQLQAHAWLECQGRIVLGGFSALSRYTALADFEP